MWAPKMLESTIWTSRIEMLIAANISMEASNTPTPLSQSKRPVTSTGAHAHCEEVPCFQEPSIASGLRRHGGRQTFKTSTVFAQTMKALERENRELRQANEILRKASAYFAMAELDRPLKR